MDEKSVQDRAAETRAAARTNLFLAASLHSGGVAHPVRIRDLSASGARIETFVVPEVGAALKLVRGRLSVDCHLTWCVDHVCGLRFSSSVSVHEWMTYRIALESRLDDLAPTADGAPVPDPAAARLEAASARLEAGKAVRAARDLKRVARLLETLAEALAGDPEVVARHGAELHNLGLAMQTLTALAETMQASAQRGPGQQAAQ